MKKPVYSLRHSALLIFLIVIGSCHKNNSSPSYISFLANGSPITYSTGAGCILNSNDSLDNYTADFAADNNDISSQISIELISSTPFTTSSPYIDSVNLAGPPVTINFYPSGLSYGNPVTLSSFYLFPNHVTLQLTAITSTYVRGNFSGNIATAYNAPITKITNGHFYLSVK